MKMEKALIGFALTVLLGCGSPAAEDPEVARLAKEGAGLTAGFSFKLYSELLKDRKDESLFVSPASVALAVALAHAGAAGGTRDEIARALAWADLPPGEVDRQFHALLSYLKSVDPGVRLEIAQSAWVRTGFPLKKEYVSLLEDRYGARAEEIDFSSPKAAAAINGWVKDHTGGKIGSIVSGPIPSAVVLSLINAIYFKGEWKEKFEKSATREHWFHLPKGGKKLHPFMGRTGTYGYCEEAGFQAIRIPYGKKDRMAFYVFLPREKASLSDFHTLLTEANWKTWMEKFSPRECILELPRFRFEFGLDLVPALSALGMADAFQPERADFTGLSPLGKKLFIGSVLQKTFVDVNEEGTEAVAVTMVEMKIASAPPRPIPFRVDRPFFCAIRDDATGAILFMGSIVEPKS